ncbi:alginate lyase family protein [Kribbella sp. VKM Ac-2566]|uniref:alginate lyase family protein n=1 Tax=Kribbella sp. VKM Ac-2566 TaxID=2512218 RepID=UPI0010645733|nr:alginate lyase family protein [Kribbella sp. VKM Ac-2566]TDW92739.1 putative Ig domain-containing protein [Kribbella sp. VKM Ac-2566]
MPEPDVTSLSTVSRRTLLIASGGSVLAAQLGSAATSTAAPTGSPAPAAFRHPGLLHDVDDLQRMRQGVADRVGPVYDGFLAMAAHSRSSYDYVIRNVGQITSWGRGPANFMNEAVSDSGAAYQNALMWSATGDVRYADKARDILDAWSNSLTAITGADGQLGVGLQVFKFANAAEILRHSGYDGWSPAAVLRCAESFRKVWYPAVSGNALFANGNWDLAALQAILAIAVFCDDRVMLENAVRYAVAGAGNGRIEHIVVSATGQGQESGRSQSYAQLALGLLANCAAVAWNQGIDLFGHQDNRILHGFEYTARYNLGDDSVPFVVDLDRTGKYLKRAISTINRGAFQPIYELAYAHYVSRRGLSAPNVERVVFRGVGGTRFVEGNSDDHPAWGTFTQARPVVARSAPDAAPGVPSGLSARRYDAGVVLTWAESVEPRSGVAASSYTISRATGRAGDYAVVAEGIRSTTWSDASARGRTTYSYKVRAENQAGSSSESLPVTIARPDPWVREDIGQVAAPGTTGFDGERFTVEAGGTDIGGEQDSFRLVYVPLRGDGVITARVVHPVSSQYATIGVMMRQSLSASSAHASMLIKGLPLHTWSGVWTVRPAGGVSTVATGSTVVPPTQQHCITVNAGFPISDLGTLPQSATPLPPPYVEAASDGYRLRRPYWVRLVRRGDVLTGLISPNGSTWTEVGTSRINLGRDVYAGLAVCAGIGVDAPYAESTTAAFDNVTVQDWSGEIPSAPLGELRAGSAGSAIELAWSDLDVAATYTVKRRHADGPYRAIASGVAPIGFGVETRYRDVTAVPGESYDYVVAKTNAAGTGSDSSKLTATMQTPAVPSITSAGSAFANTGTEFRFRVAASNDPINFAVTGLPDGLSLDRKTGVISGRPLRAGTAKLGVSARNASGADSAEVTLTVGAPPPAPWQYADIGDYVLDERQLGNFSAVAIRTPGITSYSDTTGQFTVRGAGSDLNVIGQGMTAQYVYQAVTGDATLTARVVSRGDAARVGLLMTKSLSPFDQLSGVVLAGGTPQFVQRLRVATGLVTTPGTGAPGWLRIRRTGNTFSAEVSSDGQSWTPIGAPGLIETFGSAPYYVGLAVVSGAPFALSTAVFDEVYLA